jgi:hypothetical protein
MSGLDIATNRPASSRLTEVGSCTPSSGVMTAASRYSASAVVPTSRERWLSASSSITMPTAGAQRGARAPRDADHGSRSPSAQGRPPRL